MLVTQGNLASTYEQLGRIEEAGSLRRDVYSGWLKLEGGETQKTLTAALNYGDSLLSLERFREAKALMHRLLPVARRILGDSHNLTLEMRWLYAETRYKDAGATLDDVREAVTTLEDIEPIARRVLGGAHPRTMAIERTLQKARAAREAKATEAITPGERVTDK